jgi:hypothetical protein
MSLLWRSHFLPLDLDDQSAAWSLPHLVFLADDAALADLPSPTGQYGVTLAAALSLAGVCSSVATYHATVADALGWADVSLPRAHFVIVADDGTSLADAVSAKAALNATLTEALNLSDDLRAVALVTLADGLSLADALSLLAAYRAHLTDDPQLADTLSARMLRPLEVPLGDSVTIRALVVLSAPGPVAFADATTRFHPADVTPGTSFTDAGAVLLFVVTTHLLATGAERAAAAERLARAGR